MRILFCRFSSRYKKSFDILQNFPFLTRLVDCGKTVISFPRKIPRMCTLCIFPGHTWSSVSFSFVMVLRLNNTFKHGTRDTSGRARSNAAFFFLGIDSSFNKLLLQKEELEQKHLHLLQIVESEKTAKWQYTQQCEELASEIKKLRAEVSHISRVIYLPHDIFHDNSVPCCVYFYFNYCDYILLRNVTICNE